MNNRQLSNLSQELSGKSTREVDAMLHAKHLDVQARISVKHYMAMQAAADIS